MKAQLARPVENVDALIKSSKWAMQQKLDGHRLIVETGEKVRGYNRQGDIKKIPHTLEDFFSKLKTKWIFDGELLGSKYYIFDLLEVPTGNIQKWPLKKRFELLQKLEDKFNENIMLVPLIEEDKKEELSTFKKLRVEGVVFKNLAAPYLNKKSYNFLKYKFVNDVDCLVLNRAVENKSNLVLGMYDGRRFVEVGKVSSLTGDGPNVQVGDVVKVTILYSTEDGRLYQPVKPIIRDDKNKYECKTDQLKETRTCKEVFI